MARFGLDGYGRYQEVGGQRYAIEPHPFPGHPLLRLRARIEIVIWHLSRLSGVGWQP